MRGRLAEVAAHLGVEERAAYRAARAVGDDRVTQIRRGTYETSLPAGAGLPSLDAPRGETGRETGSEGPPITRLGFSLVLEVEVPAEVANPQALAERLVSQLSVPTVDDVVVVETRRRHTAFLPRRGV